MFREEQRDKDKIQRVPMGGLRQKTQLSKEDLDRFEKRGMRPHIFNDVEGRIGQALAAGYSFVKPDDARSWGAFDVDEQNTDVGAKCSKIVSKGEPQIRAYLMEYPIEFFHEDQAARARKHDKVDEALALGGKGGADVENAYVPDR